MLKLTEEMTLQVDEVVRNFFETRLGEKPHSLSCYLNNDILAVYVHGVNSPAEQAMMNSKVEKKLLVEYKAQQFESVKHELCEKINQLLCWNIRQMHTSITNDGIRIINIRIV